MKIYFPLICLNLVATSSNGILISNINALNHVVDFAVNVDAASSSQKLSLSPLGNDELSEDDQARAKEMKKDSIIAEALLKSLCVEMGDRSLNVYLKKIRGSSSFGIILNRLVSKTIENYSAVVLESILIDEGFLSYLDTDRNIKALRSFTGMNRVSFVKSILSSKDLVAQNPPWKEAVSNFDSVEAYVHALPQILEHIAKSAVLKKSLRIIKLLNEKTDF